MNFYIQVGKSRHERSFLVDRASDNGQSILAHARINKTPVFCLCADEPLPLFVRKDESGYTLVRPRGHGTDHHEACPSGKEYKSDETIYKAIKEDKLSSILHRLKSSLLDSNDLAFLLHYLWCESGYAEWTPAFAGYRNSMRMKMRLRKAAESISLGDFTLADILVMPYESTKQAENKSDSYLKITKVIRAKSEQYGIQPIVIAQVKEIGPIAHSYPVKFHDLKNHVWMDKVGIEELHRLSAFALSVIGATELRAIGIFQVKASDSNFINAKFAHVMAVTEEWVPVMNKQHWVLVKHLIRDERQFRLKPSQKGHFNIELLDTVVGDQTLYIAPWDSKPATIGAWFWDSARQHLPPAIPKPF